MMFRPLELSDKALFEKYAFREKTPVSESSFVFTYTWRHKYRHDIACTDNALFVYCEIEGRGYIKALGVLDWKQALRDLNGIAPELDLVYLTRWDKQRLEEIDFCPLVFTEDRANADYFYNAEEMRTLSGKKFHSKRNFCSRFEREASSWCYEPIEDGNLSEVWDFHRSWRRKSGHAACQTLQEEDTAIALALQNISALNLRAGLLRRNGQVAAFTVGSKTSEACVQIHIEKADHDIAGAYPMIFREFARHACTDVTVINREDDMGLENLRKAKLSYHPIDIAEKYTARRRR